MSMLSDYEIERQRNIERNRSILQGMGLLSQGTPAPSKETGKKKKKKKRGREEAVVPQRTLSVRKAARSVTYEEEREAASEPDEADDSRSLDQEDDGGSAYDSKQSDGDYDTDGEEDDLLEDFDENELETFKQRPCVYSPEDLASCTNPITFTYTEESKRGGRMLLRMGGDALNESSLDHI